MIGYAEHMSDWSVCLRVMIHDIGCHSILCGSGFATCLPWILL
jgi:hypothetical protein